MASVLAASYVVPIECLKLLWDPMTRRLGYIFYFHRKLRELEGNKDTLASAKADVLREVENAEIRGCIRTAEVISWLRDADKAVAEAENICSNARSMIENSAWFRIKIAMRYKLGKQIVRASKFSSDVQGRKVVNLFVPPPPIAVLPYPTSLIKNNTSSSRTLAKLRNFLQDDRIGKIGIWGMGGVGKTRLMRNLNNELQGTERFDVVIFVTVSKNWNKDMQKLRNDIGKELYMELDKESEVRALRLLYKRLMQKRFLLILDDVWEKIDLENLGIPSPTENKGCKIAITTRQRGICNEMETDVEIMVEVLPDEESWDLFNEKAGGNIPTTIENVARSVCGECCGLPLAIITVGSALRKEVHLDQWKRALRLLQESNFGVENMEDRVFVPLKFSYDMLRDDQLKKCFLFVALFPEDHDIAVQDLIEYWVMEGYLDGAKSLRDAHQDAHRLLILLIDSCLLESRKQGMVKMHDVIRDMAIKITADSTEEGKRFWVKAGMRLEELVETEDLKDKDKISLMENNIQWIEVDLYCPDASTLLVKGNVRLYEIPEGFFQHMKQLSVLDLSATSIEFLPESISVLVNLSALILRECPRLRSIDCVQCLKKLRFLDIRESGIIELPEGMVHLTGLVYFNISYTYRLQKIPARLIARFSHLEDLEMNQSAYFKVSQQNTPEIIKELQHLKSLSSLSLDLENDRLPSLLETHCNLKNLTSFYLRVGSMATSKTEYVGKKEGRPREPERRGSCLDITLNASDCGRLVKYANKLCVYHNILLRSISELGLDNLERVEECWVWNCEAMKNIIISEGGKDNAYPHLELLHLERLPELVHIFSYDNVVAAPSFFSLRKINLCDCHTIRFVFAEEMISQLGCLEELEVSLCRSLQGIIEGFSGRDGMCLPKLRCISLSGLSILEQL